MSRSVLDISQTKSGASGKQQQGQNESSSSSSTGNHKNGSRPKDRGATNNNIILDDSSDDDNAEKIRVGKNYQVVCPEFGVNVLPKESIPEKALLLWAPSDDLLDSQLDDYVRIAKDKYGYNAEQALGMLFWHKFDLDRALQDLSNFTPYPNEWTYEDEVLFEQAFQFHGKSFNRIRQMLPDKTVGSLVKYYYSWKKTRTKTSVMDRQEQMQVKNGNSDNSSERDSNENSDVDDKNIASGIQKPLDTAIPSTSSSKDCSGCGVACSEVHNTLHGNLCSSCYHHYRRTGTLRPTSAPSFMGKRSRQNDNGKHKRAVPKGIYFNHDDIVALATAKQNPNSNQNDIIIGMEREIASHWTTIQSNKQNITAINDANQKQFIGLQPPDMNHRVSVRWTNEECLLAVQGVRNHGKDFATIANILGTKTEAQLRTFFVNYRRRYNLDQLVREHEAANGGNTIVEKTKEPVEVAPVEIDLDEENTNVNSNGDVPAVATTASAEKNWPQPAASI